MKTIVTALLAGYVSGDLSLETFQEWFIPATWDARKIPDPDTMSLVRAVQLSLAEFLSGDISESDLKRDLGALISRPVIVRAAAGSARLETSSTADCQVIPVAA